MDGYFSDFFKVSPESLHKYGAFNISLSTDLPLFIDPFLLFNSKKPEYKILHDQIITYLKFLRDKADSGTIEPGLLKAWFTFPEVKQTWLGFTQSGNRGSGLGRGFAGALHENLHRMFGDFGKEKITKGSHLEKLCLIKDRVGKDNISDFTTNLIKGFLCEYTEAYAKKNIEQKLCKNVAVSKVLFNYDTETWGPRQYALPCVGHDYVLLTPMDILTKDDTWINKTDLIEEFDALPNAISNDQLRDQVSNYFQRIIPKHRDKPPTREEEKKAAVGTILKFPVLIDIYIRHKEDRGDQAESISGKKVEYSRQLYVEQFKYLRQSLESHTDFYRLKGDTYEDAHQRVTFLKDVIENKGGHRIFYVHGKPIEREEDLHIMYRLTWFGTISEVSREANDGRGPVDFKISRGSKDKTLVEFKLASNSQLRRNLEKQTQVYEKASDAKRSIKVIVYFSKTELAKVIRILKELNLLENKDVVLIDARKDNKPSGSKA
jgi:hypothetical protein